MKAGVKSLMVVTRYALSDRKSSTVYHISKAIIMEADSKLMIRTTSSQIFNYIIFITPSYHSKQLYFAQLHTIISADLQRYLKIRTPAERAIRNPYQRGIAIVLALVFSTGITSRSVDRYQRSVFLTKLLLYRNDPEQCYQYLSYLDRYELNKPAYNDYGHQAAKITIYNNLTGLALAKATREVSREEAEKFMNDARRYLNSSEKVRMTVDKSIILNRAFLHYYGGQVSKALNFVNKTYEETHKTGQGKHLLTTTILMMAQIHFVKKNYAKSLELYKRCMEINKGLPTRARLGMAYCFFYLAKYELARACFQRILKLDPTCVQAYVGIAVVCDKQENYAQYFEFLKSAYLVNRNHPLVLVHLAQHFLLKGDVEKAKQYSQQGLLAIDKIPKFLKAEENCRNDFEEYRGRFYNIQGQVHHISNTYPEASRCYTLAVGKGLLHNEIALAQTYINPTSVNYIEAIKLLEDAYRSMEGKDARLLNDSYKLMAYLKSKIPSKNKEERNAQFYYGQALKYNKQDFEAKIQYAVILVETNKQKALKQLEEVEKILLANKAETKAELLNNIAVLQLENGEISKCETRLLKCLQQIQQIKSQPQEEQVRRTSLLILSKFNYGICMQKQIKWESARILYEQVIALNKFHQDSYIRLAYVLYNLGNYKKMIQVFEDAEKVCAEAKSKLIRVQKLWNIKAYLQHMSGSSSEAKQTIKQLGKHKDIYTQVFQICINYENIMRKGVELPLLKEFLRPNRDFCYKYCNEDHNAAFAYMLLAIVLLSDKKITKAQGFEYFNNLKQFSADDLPSILYNMGLFLTQYDDHENSNAMFNLYKQKVGPNSRSQEIIALNHFLDSDYTKCESIIKRNILRDPANLKNRLQLFYVIDTKCQNYYQKKNFTKQVVEKYLRHMKASLEFYVNISKLTISDIGRGLEIPELKERLRNFFVKMKASSEERYFYIKSLIESYEKIHKEVSSKEQEKEQLERIKKEKEEAEMRERELQQLLEDDVESEDQEEKERKEKEKKRQRALDLARKQQEELENNWNELKEKEKYLDDEKKARKRNTNSNPKPVRSKRQKKGKEASEEEMIEEKESEPEAEEYSSEPRKKHKHDKKDKKRRHRDRDRSEEKEEAESYEEKDKKSDGKEGDNDEDDELLNKYYL